MRSLFRAGANSIPEPVNDILCVRIPGTASDARDDAIAGLLHPLHYRCEHCLLVWALPREIPVAIRRGILAQTTEAR